MDLILVVIVACEIGFWVLVALGLLARYALRWRLAGAGLLAMTPVVDLVLLSAVIVDLRGGGTATAFHGLAAPYLGLSLAYRHKMVRSADVRFAHRFAGDAAPVKLFGRGHTKTCWSDVVCTAVAVGIAAGVLWLLTAVVQDPSRTSVLSDIYPVLGIWFVVDIVWAVSYTIWPRVRPVPAP